MKKWKKIGTLLLTTLLFLLLQNTDVSAAEINAKAVSPINATLMPTGSESKAKLPVYKASYTRREPKENSDFIELWNSKHYGVCVPIKISEKGQFYIEFVGAQKLSAPVQIVVVEDMKTQKGFAWNNMKTSAALTSAPLKTGVMSEGTHYLMLYSFDKDSLTTNSFSFRTYFYSAKNKTLSNKKWIATADANGEDRYYKFNMPNDGHVQVQSDVEQEIAICNNSKKTIYNTKYYNKLESDNQYTASYYLKKGTYYIRTKGKQMFTGSGSGISKLRYVYYKLGSSPYLLKNKKTVTLYMAGDEKVVHYIKYKASANGYISINAIGASIENVQLCNSSRKALTSATKLYGDSGLTNSVLYNVRKGYTYYLKVSNSVSKKIQLGFMAKTVAEKSGNSKKKAVKIKSGKTVNGVVEIGNKKGDWYKFTVKKHKPVKITVKGRSNGTMNITLYNSAGKKVFSDAPFNEKSNGTYSLQYGDVFLNKGIYYIKITGKNTKTCGFYSLKWK